MKDSFTGDDTQTIMMAMIAPNAKNCEHTLNTLRYAYRVKEIAEATEGDELAEPMGAGTAAASVDGSSSAITSVPAIHAASAKESWVSVEQAATHVDETSFERADEREAAHARGMSAAPRATAGKAAPKVPARPPRLSPASAGTGGYVDVLNGDDGLKGVLDANRRHASLLGAIAETGAELVVDMESPGALSRMQGYSDALEELIKRERASLQRLEVRAAGFRGKLRQQEAAFLRS